MSNKRIVVTIFAFLFLVGGSGSQAVPPLSGVLVMLDPGHGGSDPGAVGPTGLRESETNLRVAKYLRLLLKADGANVIMTRDSDIYLSLQDRVDRAAQEKPDLFVSIHHNASLNPNTPNHGEIYFNSLDRGIPLRTAMRMKQQLADVPLEGEPGVIPGGFFVLRNNSAPAVLTEASYISDTEGEKALSTGKRLTHEAKVFRDAIKEVFSTPPLKIEFFSKKPAKVTACFFNFIFSANKPIEKIKLKSSYVKKLGIRFDPIPSFGYNYSIYNSLPVQSGDYELAMTFYGKDGSISPIIPLNLQVRLPMGNSILLPVAPYIPEGYRGKFPLQLVLKDTQNRINEQSVPFKLSFGNKVVSGTTRPDGKASIIIDIDGTEKERVEAFASVDGAIIAQTTIPVISSPKTAILGRITSSITRDGIEGVKVHISKNRTLATGVGGFFFCELSPIFRNLQIDIIPPLGYSKETRWIKSNGERVVKPEYILAPIAPNLLGKKIGIIAGRKYDSLVRPLVRDLMKSGVNVVRLPYDESKSDPERSSSTAANKIRNLDFLLSFKSDNGTVISVRHYHRGGSGKKLAEDLIKALHLDKKHAAVKIEPGSDYELGHTAAPTAVFGIPMLIPPDVSTSLMNALISTIHKTL